MCTHKTQEAEKHLTTLEMAISVHIWAGHSAKESPEIVVPHMCVNFKKMALLVAKHVGCDYTPGCGYAQPSPASLKHWPIGIASKGVMFMITFLLDYATYNAVKTV